MVGFRRSSGCVGASVLIALAAISGCSSDDDSPAVEATTTTVTVAPAVEPVHQDEAQAQAEGRALTAADVPEGWAPLPDAEIDDVDDQVRTCLGVDPGIGEIGRSSSGFSYVTASGASTTISSMVRVYADPANAAANDEAWRDEAVPGCLDQVFRRSLGAGVKGETTPAALDGLDGVVALRAEYSGGGGSIGMVLAVIREGTEVAMVRGVGVNTSVQDEDLVRAASAVRSRLKEG